MKNSTQLQIGIFTSINNGGIRVYYETLAKSLSALGFQVHLFSGNIFSCLYKAFAANFSNSDYKFVFLTYGAYNLLPYLPGHVISTFHGLPSLRHQGIFRVILLVISLYYSSLVSRSMVSISFFTYSGLKHLYGVETELIPNCLPQDFVSTNSNTLVVPDSFERPIDVLFLGRLNEGKLPVSFVLALAELVTNLGLNITIAGSGPDYKHKILRELNKRGLNDCISFVGDVSRNEARLLFQHSKVFFSLSEFEPFGLVYLEAYVSGCQLVGPACGGFLEIASVLSRNNNYDFFFYFNPQPESFIDVIKHSLLSFSSTSRTRLPERQILANWHYGPHLQAEAYAKLISKITNQSSPGIE